MAQSFWLVGGGRRWYAGFRAFVDDFCLCLSLRGDPAAKEGRIWDPYCEDP